MRISSYLDLAQQTIDRRRWRHLCGLKAPVHHEIFGYATERMDPEDWRQNQARVAKELKRNKRLESAKIKGLLFVSIDANEHFASFSRTCRDTELAAAIDTTLKWSAVVPTDKVRVTVANGWVTLTGELDWEYQRASVEKTVRTLIGVTGISNEITLKPRTTPSYVSGRIQDALKRQAEREARRIQVEVSGATVTLRGSVHSWQERDAAAGAAWAAPGVRGVINELRLSV